MAGLNRQGPRGKGMGTGRQRGMCRRTNQLDCKGFGFRNTEDEFQARKKQENIASSAERKNMAEEVEHLKTRYAQISKMASDLAKKIEAIEGNK